MITDRTHNYISPEEYLKLEELSPLKHEYIQGQVNDRVLCRTRVDTHHPTRNYYRDWHERLKVGG